jgi:signal transduction histidine kinase
MRKLAVVLLLLFTAIGAYAQNKLNDHLREALRLAKEDTSKIILLDSLSYTHTWSSADSALTYGMQALKIAQKISYSSGIANAEALICGAFTVLGNYPQAVDYGLKSLDLCKKLNDPYSYMHAYAYLGLCYREQGDDKKSLEYFHKGFNLIRQYNLSDDWYLRWCAIASSAYAKDHQPDSALFYGLKAFKHDNTNSGIAYVLGSAYAQKGQYELAMGYYRKTIIFAHGGAEIDILDAYNGMASLFVKTGQTDSAIYYAKKALSQKWGKTYPIGVFHATELLTNIYEKENATDSTLKYLKLNIVLKDGLYSSQKERDIQNIDFNNQLQQQALDQQQNKAQTRLILISLAGGMFTFFVIGFMQWRSNQHKQKAYLLLEKQKLETDVQKEKAEKALEDLQSTQTQLIQREKMASLGELTAGIAHEIQNPLNFVNNFSDVNQEMLEELKAESEKPKAERDEVLEKELINDLIDNEQKINHHGKRADSIVKGMLQHSRASSGQKEPTDLNALADEYLRLAYHGLRAKDKDFNADLVTNFDDKLPKVNVIPQDIGRVLLNIINNAFYATQQKAKTAGTGYKPAIEISTAQQNGSVMLAVKDNGDGIPESIKDKIMQPFFTTKPTGEGTGLGLSLSYDIVVKGHGGKIDLKSNEGEGSEFTVMLPV